MSEQCNVETSTTVVLIVLMLVDFMDSHLFWVSFLVVQLTTTSSDWSVKFNL